jgi:hypothetical protein
MLPAAMLSKSGYAPGQMSYDLRRAPLAGPIRRLDQTHRYVLTPDGIKVVVFYADLHNRLLRPLLATRWRLPARAEVNLEALRNGFHALRAVERMRTGSLLPRVQLHLVAASIGGLNERAAQRSAVAGTHSSRPSANCVYSASKPVRSGHCTGRTITALMTTPPGLPWKRAHSDLADPAWSRFLLAAM